MALPTYDKSKRKQTFQQLPKGAYVVKIMNAKEVPNKSGNGSHIDIAFDICEGEYRNFYKKIFEGNTNEDKKWPNDAIFRLTVPNDGSQQFIWDNWNSFFADLEDSNSGFVFGGDVRTLKNKLIGGKFHNEQSESNGTVYDHIRMKWTCVADDVRNGRAGRLPNDKLITAASRGSAAPATDSDGFMKVPDTDDDDIPF